MSVCGTLLRHVWHAEFLALAARYPVVMIESRPATFAGSL